MNSATIAASATRAGTRRNLRGFSHSNSPVIRPYFALMPKLHRRLNGSVDPSEKQTPS
jgi:hypothetical protein